MPAPESCTLLLKMFMIDMDNHHNFFFLMIVEGHCPGLQEAHFYAIQLIELAMFLLDKKTILLWRKTKINVKLQQALQD